MTEPDRAERVVQIALDELARVKRHLTDEEVVRAKNKISSGIALQGEAPMGRMRAIAAQWMYNGQYRSLEQDMATLENVTADSLRSLMKDFPFEPMTLVSLGP